MVRIKQEYFKRSRPGEPPITYRAWGKRSTNKVTKVLIKKDPTLKKNPKLEKAMMKHELVEIRLRAKGMDVKKAHKIAMSKESALTRNLSLKDMWRMLKCQ